MCFLYIHCHVQISVDIAEYMSFGDRGIYLFFRRCLNGCQEKRERGQKSQIALTSAFEISVANTHDVISNGVIPRRIVTSISNNIECVLCNFSSIKLRVDTFHAGVGNFHSLVFML